MATSLVIGATFISGGTGLAVLGGGSVLKGTEDLGEELGDVAQQVITTQDPARQDL